MTPFCCIAPLLHQQLIDAFFTQSHVTYYTRCRTLDGKKTVDHHPSGLPCSLQCLDTRSTRRNQYRKTTCPMRFIITCNQLTIHAITRAEGAIASQCAPTAASPAPNRATDERESPHLQHVGCQVPSASTTMPLRTTYLLS